jgi:hypothetical protein
VTSAKKSRGYRAWPERWPVAAPLIGAGFTLSAAAVIGAADGDWMDATLLAALAAVFGGVAARNSRDLGRDGAQRRRSNEDRRATRDE